MARSRVAKGGGGEARLHATNREDNRTMQRHRLRSMTRALVLLLAASLAAPGAAAKDEAPRFEDYAKLRRRAESAFEAASYVQALDLFEQSLRIAPCDEAHVNVLRTLRNLGRLRDAVVLAEGAIASREERLNVLVDRGMLMFQDRELFAEIAGTAVFLVWGCDAQARRIDGRRPGGPLLAACGGAEGARTIGALVGRDPDSYVLDRFDLYLHEREDSGHHEPLAYEAAEDVLARRGDLEGARTVARRAAADALAAEVERQRGPTPFIPSPEDLESAAPKWLAIGFIYEESCFPELVAECRSRAKGFAELAAAAEAGLSRQEIIARRRAIHAAARSERGPSGPALSARSIVSRPRTEPGLGGVGEADAASPAEVPSSRARWSHALGPGGVQVQRVEVGSVVTRFEIVATEHALALRLLELSGPRGVDSSVRLTSPDLPELSRSLTRSDEGKAIELGSDESLPRSGPEEERILVLDFVVELGVAMPPGQ